MRLDEKNIHNQESGLKNAVETLERKLIYESLQKTHWHRGKTADLLKIPRRTLQRKMVKYGFRKIEQTD